MNLCVFILGDRGATGGPVSSSGAGRVVCPGGRSSSARFAVPVGNRGAQEV